MVCFVRLLAACCGFFLPGTAAAADLPNLSCSSATTSATVPVSVCVVPDGSGTPLTAAYASAGLGRVSRVDATITLIVRACLDPPETVQMYPAEDMWLMSSLGGLEVCPWGTIADGPTDAQGRTTFTSAPKAGGHTDPAAGERTLVWISGNSLDLQRLDIQFNSPDIDGNGVVDLTDAALYSADVLGGGYAYRSDFYYDQQLNLSDIAVLARAVGKSCP